MHPDKLRLKEDNFVTKRSFHGAAPHACNSKRRCVGTVLRTGLNLSPHRAVRHPLFPRLQSTPSPWSNLLLEPYPDAVLLAAAGTLCPPIAVMHGMVVRVISSRAPMYQPDRAQPVRRTNTPSCMQGDLARGWEPMRPIAMPRASDTHLGSIRPV